MNNMSLASYDSVRNDTLFSPVSNENLQNANDIIENAWKAAQKHRSDAAAREPPHQPLHSGPHSPQPRASHPQSYDDRLSEQFKYFRNEFIEQAAVVGVTVPLDIVEDTTGRIFHFVKNNGPKYILQMLPANIENMHLVRSSLSLLSTTVAILSRRLPDDDKLLTQSIATYHANPRSIPIQESIGIWANESLCQLTEGGAVSVVVGILSHTNVTAILELALNFLSALTSVSDEAALSMFHPPNSAYSIEKNSKIAANHRRKITNLHVNKQPTSQPVKRIRRSSHYIPSSGLAGLSVTAVSGSCLSLCLSVVLQHKNKHAIVGSFAELLLSLCTLDSSIVCQAIAKMPTCPLPSSSMSNRPGRSYSSEDLVDPPHASNNPMQVISSTAKKLKKPSFQITSDTNAVSSDGNKSASQEMEWTGIRTLTYLLTRFLKHSADLATYLLNYQERQGMQYSYRQIILTISYLIASSSSVTSYVTSNLPDAEHALKTGLVALGVENDDRFVGITNKALANIEVCRQENILAEKARLSRRGPRIAKEFRSQRNEELANLDAMRLATAIGQPDSLLSANTSIQSKRTFSPSLPQRPASRSEGLTSSSISTEETELRKLNSRLRRENEGSRRFSTDPNSADYLFLRSAHFDISSLSHHMEIANQQSNRPASRQSENSIDNCRPSTADVLPSQRLSFKPIPENPIRRGLPPAYHQAKLHDLNQELFQAMPRPPVLPQIVSEKTSASTNDSSQSNQISRAKEYFANMSEEVVKRLKDKQAVMLNGKALIPLEDIYEQAYGPKQLLATSASRNSSRSASVRHSMSRSALSADDGRRSTSRISTGAPRCESAGQNPSTQKLDSLTGKLGQESYRRFIDSLRRSSEFDDQRARHSRGSTNRDSSYDNEEVLGLLGFRIEGEADAESIHSAHADEASESVMSLEGDDMSIQTDADDRSIANDGVDNEAFNGGVAFVEQEAFAIENESSLRAEAVTEQAMPQNSSEVPQLNTRISDETIVTPMSDASAFALNNECERMSDVCSADNHTSQHINAEFSTTADDVSDSVEEPNGDDRRAAADEDSTGDPSTSLGNGDGKASNMITEDQNSARVELTADHANSPGVHRIGCESLTSSDGAVIDIEASDLPRAEVEDEELCNKPHASTEGSDIQETEAADSPGCEMNSPIENTPLVKSTNCDVESSLMISDSSIEVSGSPAEYVKEIFEHASVNDQVISERVEDEAVQRTTDTSYRFGSDINDFDKYEHSGIIMDAYSNHVSQDDLDTNSVMETSMLDDEREDLVAEEAGDDFEGNKPSQVPAPLVTVSLTLKSPRAAGQSITAVDKQIDSIVNAALCSPKAALIVLSTKNKPFVASTLQQPVVFFPSEDQSNSL